MQDRSTQAWDGDAPATPDDPVDGNDHPIAGSAGTRGGVDTVGGTPIRGRHSSPAGEAPLRLRGRILGVGFAIPPGEGRSVRHLVPPTNKGWIPHARG